MTARLVERPDQFPKLGAYRYTYVLKYKVVSVHRQDPEGKHPLKAGDEIFVGHYKPWLPRSQIKDSDWGDSPLGGKLDQFVAGEVHRLALDYELQDLAPSGALDYCFPPATNRFFALWANRPMTVMSHESHGTAGVMPCGTCKDGMVFTTHIFVFYFLPVFLLVYFNFPYRWRNLWITVASYIFYGWWQPWFVCLMMFTTVMDFIWGKVITRPGATPAQRKLAVIGLRRDQPELPRLLQVLHVLGGDAEPAPGRGGRRAIPGAARRAAHRDLLLHLPLADLHH